ncbi:MAG: hypothetical protein KAI24_06530 [Planctomycetes bacterium]|nr:hypothetical protein [Planctomycetota bacterium]
MAALVHIAATSGVRDGMRTACTLLLAACAASPAPPPPTPAALPQARHGHRVERLAGGWLCFGGFSAGAAADRGARHTLWLGDGDLAWSRRADCRLPHAFFASGVHRGHAIAIGPGVECYDAAADTWRVIVPDDGRLPRSHFCAAVLDGAAIVLGGFPTIGTGCHRVDLDTGEVTQLQPPPSFEAGDHLHIACVLAGELHVLGGLGDDLLREHWVRRDGSWQRLADCPTGLWSKFTAHVVHDGDLWLLGGQPEAASHRYDPATATWHRLQPPPGVLAMPVAVVADDAIVLIGGLPVGEPTGRRSAAVLWRYDPLDDRWQVTPRRRGAVRRGG